MSTANIEVLVGAAYISQPPAQMVPFLLAGGLYRPPAGIFTTGGFHMHPQLEIDTSHQYFKMDNNNK
jgi:hypothetical protein